MDLPKWLYLICKRGDIKPYLLHPHVLFQIQRNPPSFEKREFNYSDIRCLPQGVFFDGNRCT